MTKNTKLAKLAHAIRDYRGTYDPETGKWRRAPDQSARPRVERWLGELKLDVAGSLTLIDSFKTTDDMRAWLAKI